MNKRYLFFIIAIFVLLMPNLVSAPPIPHNIRGIVYNIGGSYAIGSFPVSINNTNTSDFVRTRTNGVGPPIISASYAATINGSDGDTIIVKAWNNTNYGTNTTVLAPTTTYVNIVLNTTRPSETNVTIITPINNSIYNMLGYFNVTARIAIMGGQNGIDCSAVISFSDANLLKLAPAEASTHNLEDINFGSFTTTTWNISTNLTGNSNISVLASCTSDEENFDNLSRYTAYNITVKDIAAPVVGLEYPLNNTKITGSASSITFRYNVSDDSDIANCSLVIKNQINLTNYTIAKGITQEFSLLLTDEAYNWSVNCTDNSTSHNTGASSSFNLTLIYNSPPTITGLIIDDPIYLNIGSIKTVYCNATINDENNISDIKSINSTLYHNSVEASADDDNNNHYTNTTCKLISESQYAVNYSCSFSIYYYADAGAWNCNITAADNSDTVGTAKIGATVNELLAIDISPSIIDYEGLNASESSISDFTVNITNLGNMDFNITTVGFGRIDGDNLSMNCTKGNISVEFQKYSIYESTPYNSMTSLSGIPAMISNLELLQRTNDTTYKNDRNYTYWKIGIPVGVSGLCTGFVTFNSVSG